MNCFKGILLGLILSGGIAFGQDNITIPNVITPDGDGVNDVFFVKSSGYEELTCTIYTRHGEVIYRYYGLNGTWDAHSHAGIKVSAGCYFVFIEATAADGSIITKQGILEVVY